MGYSCNNTGTIERPACEAWFDAGSACGADVPLQVRAGQLWRRGRFFQQSGVSGTCRFKCRRPPGWKRHFHSNVDRAHHTQHFALQRRVSNGAPSLCPHNKPARCFLCREHSAGCCQQPISRSVCSFFQTGLTFC